MVRVQGYDQANVDICECWLIVKLRTDTEQKEALPVCTRGDVIRLMHTGTH